jgi:uncharacterized membrane protein YhaH (DUF805 family)
MTEQYDTPYQTPSALPDYSLQNDKVLSANGRFGRLSYLAWSLVILLGFALVAIVVGIIVGVASHSGTPPTTLLFVLLGIGYIALLYFAVIFGIRRLHDLDKSGWLWLINLIPFVGIFFSFYLLFASGTNGPNRFGPQRQTPGWEKILGWVYIAIIPLIGILAAIAIPAYQGYVDRAHLAQQSQLSSTSEPSTDSTTTTTTSSESTTTTTPDAVTTTNTAESTTSAS